MPLHTAEEILGRNLALVRARERGEIGGTFEDTRRFQRPRSSGPPLNPLQALGMVPFGSPLTDIAGVAGDIQMFRKHPETRTPVNIGLSALGALPFFPPLAAGTRAFHASPHTFDKFELSERTIGTGEGAQRFGYGLYFAENPKVAEEYLEVLSAGRGADDNDVIARLLKATGGNKEKAAVEFENRAKSVLRQDPQFVAGDPKEAAKRFSLMADKVRSGADPRGTLFEVDIPNSEVSKMLDLDEQLKNQPGILRKIRRSYTLDTEDLDDTGLEFVRNLEREMDANEVSRFLREAGIPGSKFLDQGSRATGKGTRNLVVFDDSIVKIKKKTRAK